LVQGFESRDFKLQTMDNLGSNKWFRIKKIELNSGFKFKGRFDLF
jgi:hypothetical protein